ncbi:MAG: GNAT family N-acetyltransferase [Candidatus Thorarchaeota archaeon]
MEKNGLFFQICRESSEIEAAKDGVSALLEGLGNNILQNVGNIELGKALHIFVRNNENKVVGGTITHLFGGWVYISLLWIEESLRNNGYGTELMDIVEREALELGCKFAHLETYSFEAKPFYEKRGYQVFAVLENYPIGHKKYYLKKELAR